MRRWAADGELAMSNLLLLIRVFGPITALVGSWFMFRFLPKRSIRRAVYAAYLGLFVIGWAAGIGPANDLLRFAATGVAFVLACELAWSLWLIRKRWLRCTVLVPSLLLLLAFSLVWPLAAPGGLPNIFYPEQMSSHQTGLLRYEAKKYVTSTAVNHFVVYRLTCTPRFFPLFERTIHSFSSGGIHFHSRFDVVWDDVEGKVSYTVLRNGEPFEETR